MVDFSLYFHIPFCKKKCDYCHFFVIPDQERFKIAYMKALQEEWEEKKGMMEGKRLVSVYFGGGTPALLGPERIGKILEWIQPDEGIEVTLEANPENVTVDEMRLFRKGGVNRVSLGVQSLDGGELKLLSREHSANKSVEAVLAIKEAGIDNISIDLMYDVPHQTVEKFDRSLKKAISLPITHLSLYNLTIEPHTAFAKRPPPQPDEETSLELLELAVQRLDEGGFSRYEVSAFERGGHRSMHNMGYWTGRPFLGLGPSAWSDWKEERFRNVANFWKYCRGMREDERENLPAEHKLRERLAVRLRLLDPIPLDEVKIPLDELKQLEGLVEVDETVRLTPRGINFSDHVSAEILLEP